MSEKQLIQMKLSDEIITLVRDYAESDDFPNGDMQGVAEAIAVRYIK